VVKVGQPASIVSFEVDVEQDKNSPSRNNTSRTPTSTHDDIELVRQRAAHLERI
jgi:hypothetical protein